MTKDITVAEIDERTKKIIWRGLTTKSVEKLAEETGLSRDEVVRIRYSLMDRVDALTLDQERQVILMTLHELSQKAMDEFNATDDARSKAPLLSASVSALKLVLTQLKELEKAGNSQVEALNALRRNELVALMQATVTNGVMQLAERYNWDNNELQSVFGVFNDHLAEEARKMDARHEV